MATVHLILRLGLAGLAALMGAYIAVACGDDELGQDCEIEDINVGQGTVSKQLDACQFAYCVSTVIEKPSPNPDPALNKPGKNSTPFCTRECASVEECPAGWQCEIVFTDADLAVKNVKFKYSDKTFCIQDPKALEGAGKVYKPAAEGETAEAAK